MKYETKGAHKFAEKDRYSEGCVSEGAYSTFVNYPMQTDSLGALKNSIADFVGCELESIEVNACDEAGRIDAAVTENAEGCAASARELELWREGKIELWYCVYSFYVEEVTRKPAILEGATV